MSRQLWAVWAVVLVLLAAALWSARIYYQFGGFNDDACYVVGAQQIMHSGRLLATYEENGAPAAYFPGFSLLLVPLLLATREYWVFQAYSLLWTLVGATCTMLLARRWMAAAPSMVLGAIYALTPAGLCCGTSVMSDVPFSALFVLTLWLGTGEKPRWAWMGLLVSLVVVIRLPGVALAGAFGLPLLLGKQWRNLAVFSLGCVPGGLYTLATVLLKTGAGNYASQTESHYEQTSLLAEVWAFWGQLPGYLGREYLGGAFAPLAIVLLLLAIPAVIRRWKHPVTLAWLAYLSFCSVWPFSEPRYWLAEWPLLLLLVAERLPRPEFVLAILLALPIPADLERIRIGSRNQQFWDQRRVAYAWIREHIPPDAVLGGVMTCSLEYYTGRKVRPPGKSEYWSVYLAGAVSQGATYLVIEPDDTVIKLTGQKSTFVPPHLAEWAEQSSLVRHVYSNNLVRVYQIEPEARRLEEAMRLFPAALTAPDRKLLLKVLQLCPDFPDARKAYGDEWLEREVKQYPVDLQAAFMLAQKLQPTDPARARQIAERAQETARALGEPTAPFEPFLK